MNIAPNTLTLAATAVLFVDGVVVAAVPDSSNILIVLQSVLTILAVTAAAPLFVGAQLNSIIQGNTPIDFSPVSMPGRVRSSGGPPPTQDPQFYSILDQLNSLG